MKTDAIDMILDNAVVDEENKKFIKEALVKELTERILTLSVHAAVNGVPSVEEIQKAKEGMLCKLLNTVGSLILENEKNLFSMEADLINGGYKFSLEVTLYKNQ